MLKFLMACLNCTKGFLSKNWDKVFKIGPSKICRRQSFKSLKGYGLLKHDPKMDPWETPHRRFPGSEKVFVLWYLIDNI